jgi:hypothetical protein
MYGLQTPGRARLRAGKEGIMERSVSAAIDQIEEL